MSRSSQGQGQLLAPARKNESQSFWFETIFFGFALVIGWALLANGLDAIIPMLLVVAGIILGYFILKKPFPVAMALYMSAAAFNYYYFYCARLTGRNPGDIADFGVPATPLEQIQKDIVFFLLLGLAVVKLFRQGIEGFPVWSVNLKHPIIKLIFAFSCFVIIHATLCVMEGGKLFNIFHYTRNNIEYMAIPLLLSTVLIKSEKNLNMILKGLLYTMPIIAVLGIIEVLIGGALYERNFFGGAPFLRATSTLQNPNNLGAYLGTTLGISIIYYLYGKLNSIEKFWFWPSVIAGLTCLFMTISRSSILIFFIMVSLCVSLHIFLSYRSRNKGNLPKKRKLIIGYGILMTASALILWKYFNFYYAIIDAMDVYLDTRTTVSHARLFAIFPTVQALLENPYSALFGYTKSTISASDNTFADILLQNGIIGFILYACMGLLIFLESYKGVMNGQNRRTHFYMVALYVISFQFMHGFTSLIYKAFPHNMYFWFMVGMLVWLGNNPSQELHQKENSHKMLLDT